MAQQSQERKQETAMRATEKIGMSPWVIAAAASVLLSQYEYFVRDNRDLGLFIGLWPPTFLAFASYFRQIRMQSQIESLMPGGLRDTVNRMMGGQ